MSRVFLAEDTQLDRKIVIKVLPPELAGHVSADRFKREIQLAARLQHPHIVPVLTAASDGDILYYTMPFVEGESLGARISRDGALAIPAGVAILRDAVRALAYAHRHGVVHRDIKPDNILLSEDSAQVADFGIAKAVSAATDVPGALTTVGMSVGTPAYMAPEQGTGEPNVDHRADIYSLGAVAYEMFTGSHPFRGKSAQQMMAAHVLETPRPISETAAAVPPALASLVMRCLEKDPANRPQSADELLHLLDAAATPVATMSVPVQPRRSRWKLAGATAAGVVLLAIAGAVAFVPHDKLATAIALMRRSPAVLHPNRIIVTPFENQTGDPRLAPLGTMAADWLAQALSVVGGVEVVDSRTTMETGAVVDRIPWPFKSRDRGRALAEETGAGIVLTGAIYKDGDSLRVQARMNDAATGKLLRALTTVSGPVSSPTKVFEALNKRVIANVALAADTLSLPLSSLSEPPSMEAYEETMKGVDAYMRQDTSGYAHLSRAISIDSTYTTPIIFLAFSRLYRGNYEAADTLMARAEKLRDRMAPADRAMLDHLDAELRGDPDASFRTAEAYVKVTPGSGATPLLLISSALSTRRPKYALAVLGQIDPNRGMNLGAAFYWFYKAGALNELGQYQKALDVIDEALPRFPSDVSLLIGKGRSLAYLGRIAEIEPFIESVAGGTGSRTLLQARVATLTASTLAVIGRRADARKLASDWADRIAQSPDSALPRLRMTRITLLIIAGRWNDLPVAVQAAALVVTKDSATQRQLLSVEGVVAAHQGNRALAQQIDARLAATPGRYDLGSTKVLRAHIAAQLGDRDRAVALLTQAAAEGASLTFASNDFKFDPFLAPLLRYPPFEELIRPKG